jgi:uncharacterized protein
MGKFIIKTGKNSQFYFNLKADNGETILSSEGYTSKAACQNGIASVKTNASTDARYEKKNSADGKFYFVLKAANGEIIGKSETYQNASGRDNGIESVKANAQAAAVTEI